MIPPPRLPGWLLARLLPDRELEYVLGDLVEEYALRSRHASAVTVQCWYTMQICRSIVPLLWSSIARVGWPGTLAIAGVAWASASVAEALGIALLRLFIAPDSGGFTAASVAIGLATIAGGGYAAGRIRPSSPTVMAAIVLVVVIVLMITASGTAPLWYAIVFLIAGPLAAVGGGAIAANTRVLPVNDR
jgi:hypothetical protein